MKMRFSRRNFLKSCLGTAAVVSSGQLLTRSHASEPGNWEVGQSPNKVDGWYRGHLHQHSYWSDGSALPEEACMLYRDCGYDFVCPSDHNMFQNNPDRWVASDDRRRPLIERAVAKYNLPLETKDQNGQKYVRLRQFDEIAQMLNQEERFLLVPGFELTTTGVDGVQVHSNLINTRKAISAESIKDIPGQVPNMFMVDSNGWAKTSPRPNGLDCLQWSVDLQRSFLAEKPRQDTLYMVNHPDWIYFDVQPEWLIDQPDVHFFELINCGPTYAPKPGCWTTERFWDTVNAFRAQAGQTLLYGTATDDTHGYTPFYTNLEAAPGGSVMVRAPKLDATAVFNAMNAGDYYATTGVWLEEMHFDKGNKTLNVAVRAKEGVDYRIDFIGTKKGFNPKYETVDIAKDGRQPARQLRVYSDEIGQTFSSVNGTRAEYTMTGEELYVRARITALTPAPRKMGGKPDQQTAWTQPVF